MKQPVKKLLQLLEEHESHQPIGDKLAFRLHRYPTEVQEEMKKEMLLVAHEVLQEDEEK